MHFHFPRAQNTFNTYQPRLSRMNIPRVSINHQKRAWEQYKDRNGKENFASSGITRNPKYLAYENKKCPTYVDSLAIFTQIDLSVTAFTSGKGFQRIVVA